MEKIYGCKNCSNKKLSFVGDDPNMDHDWYCHKCHSLYYSHELESKEHNTIHNVQFIDAYAFGYALVKQGFNDVRIERTSPNKEEYSMFFTYSNYAMNGNGLHVGYEMATFEMYCTFKKDLGITGVPYLFSTLVVNPKMFDIKDLDLPSEENPTRESHSNDCEVWLEEYDDWDWDDDPYPNYCTCNLNDSWDGYSQDGVEDALQADVKNQIESMLERNEIPEIEYDETGYFLEGREWKYGEVDNPPTIEWYFN